MIAPISRLKKDEIIWLGKHRCKHRHTYLEHYNCYLREKEDRERIGFFDIEVSHLKANIGFVLSWYILEKSDEGLKWHGRVITKKELFTKTLPNPDYNLMKELLQVICNFDVVYDYYGSRFDWKYVRTRCLINNLGFPQYDEIKHKDIFYIIKNKFSLSSNSLEKACKALLGKSQKTHWFEERWMRAIQGSEDDLQYISEHNKFDCVDLMHLTEKVIGFSKIHKISV